MQRAGGDRRWAKPGERGCVETVAADRSRLRTRLATALPALTLSVLLLAVGSRAAQARLDLTALGEQTAALRLRIAEQRAALEQRPTAEELSGLERDLVAIRLAVVSVAPNRAKIVMERFVKTPNGAIGPPIYMFSRNGLEVPLYMAFCVEYELAGAPYGACLSAADYADAVSCYDQIVVGKSLPECFR